MRIRLSNGLSLEYESIGDPDDPCLLLVMGFNMQLTAWEMDFCQMLASSGLHVIRFDNRDMGLSDRLTDLGQPNPVPRVLRRMCGLPASSPYDLEAMAADGIALLDALSIKQAHVVGASMGGMIAQLMAIHYPQRILSLCSIMASTGEYLQLWPKPRMLLAFLSPQGDNLETQVRYALRFWNAAASPANLPAASVIERQTREAYARSADFSGQYRQLAAILAAPSRNHLLPTISAPTQIIHGRDDPLVRVRSASKLAALIPDARLAVIDGMGHDLPPPLVPRLANLIVENLQRG